MTLHRIFGVLMWALLVHLNLVASNTVCEQRHGESRATASASMPMSHTSNSGVMQTRDLDQQQSCETPLVADCCRLMASCAVTLGFSSTTSLSNVAVARVAVAGLIQTEPTLLARSPEPPPPKA